MASPPHENYWLRQLAVYGLIAARAHLDDAWLFFLQKLERTGPQRLTYETRAQWFDYLFTGERVLNEEP